MMRGEIDLARDPPSRLSRVMVVVATVGVAIIAAWIFVPILLANYVAHTTALVAPAPPRAAAEERVMPVAAAVAAPASVASTPRAPADTDAATQPETAPEAAPAAAPAPRPPPALGINTATAGTVWPSDPSPSPRLAAAPPATMQLASAPPAPADAIEPVPLPRIRPGRTISARLAIPLPRPRPEIESDGPTPEDQAFEREVERMR